MAVRRPRKKRSDAGTKRELTQLADRAKDLSVQLDVVAEAIHTFADELRSYDQRDRLEKDNPRER